MFMKQLIPVLLSVILGVLAACTSSQQVEDRLVLALGEALYPTQVGGHVVSEDGAGEEVLVKWTKPVRVSFFEGDNPENAESARKMLDEFSDLTGIEIIWLKANDESANFRLFFSDEPDFVINGNEQATCYTSSRGGKRGDVQNVRVYIGRDLEEETPRDCLAHETLHAFGWRGHTHRIRSAISYVHGENELTRWDRVMLRAHYDPRLKPGIPKADALPLARTILRELMRES